LRLALQGGARLDLHLHASVGVPVITADVHAQVERIVRSRLEGMRVTTPFLVKSVGTDRILVELPGAENSAYIVKTLTERAALAFRIMPDAVADRAERDHAYADDPNGAARHSGPIVVSGADLAGAQAGYNPQNLPTVFFQMRDPNLLGKITERNMGSRMGIFIDGQYVSSPVINGVITTDGEISGKFTPAYVARLANELNAGTLPVTVTVVEIERVRPLFSRR
jgi:preprotein translocase subunit SecD